MARRARREEVQRQLAARVAGTRGIRNSQGDVSVCCGLWRKVRLQRDRTQLETGVPVLNQNPQGSWGILGCLFRTLTNAEEFGSHLLSCLSKHIGIDRTFDL